MRFDLGLQQFQARLHGSALAFREPLPGQEKEAAADAGARGQGEEPKHRVGPHAGGIPIVAEQQAGEEAAAEPAHRRGQQCQ